MAEIEAFFDGLTVTLSYFAPPEVALVTAAILAKVKIIVDNIPDFNTDADNDGQSHGLAKNTDTSGDAHRRRRGRGGGGGDVEWFSALVKGHAKIRDTGRLVLGMETNTEKSAQDAALTTAQNGQHDESPTLVQISHEGGVVAMSSFASIRCVHVLAAIQCMALGGLKSRQPSNPSTYRHIIV